MTATPRLVSTGLPAGAVSATKSVELTEGWTLARTEPGAWASPAEVEDGADWRPAVVPGTVAVSVGPHGDLDGHLDYDAFDWWYRCELPESVFAPSPGRVRLRFDGLATLAEVWLNGERILQSESMFCAHEVDVTDLVRGESQLLLCFRSLGTALAERRPRPRWKTKLVEHQQLRWFRTTLLGRIPGWTPPIRPVGPWRSVRAESVAVMDVRALALRTSLLGRDGAVHVELEGQALAPGLVVRSATLCVGDGRYALAAERAEDLWTVSGSPTIEAPAPWWPHTHGEPALHACSIELETSAGAVRVDCGRIGFRRLEADRADGRIQLTVNGTPVFCRGSCWTSADVVSLVGDPARVRRSLELLAEAHGNMIRVGGTMVYETDELYRACDELGIMVWQDFMFANMDYPVEDESFAASATAEARQQVRRLAVHPSVVAWCGGSEVEQQAAMFGAPREVWTNRFFSETLPTLLAAAAPDTPYWPSTPTGGDLPFQVGEGLAHYYGVGAYRRPLEDVRLARVKFTPECLGFSHVPEADNLRKLTPHGAVPPHHPAWKRGVPRDTGPGWDFEDVRDHYLERLYGVHAVELRSDDPERYLALSRIVTGEAMAAAFSEWRREGDPCGGALTWFWNDLRPGAGWGLIDSDGQPKAAYHHLRRAWEPRCVRLLDRGLDGLVALILNESREPLEAVLELTALARGSTVVAEASETRRVAARSSAEVPVEGAFGHFVDSAYSYRFGPPRHEAVVARLLSRDGETLSEDVYRPIRSAMTPASTLHVDVGCGADGAPALRLDTDTTLYGVRIEVRDHRPIDNYFCLTPGRARSVELERVSAAGTALRGYVEALNLLEAVRFEAPA